MIKPSRSTNQVVLITLLLIGVISIALSFFLIDSERTHLLLTIFRFTGVIIILIATLYATIIYLNTPSGIPRFVSDNDKILKLMDNMNLQLKSDLKESFELLNKKIQNSSISSSEIIFSDEQKLELFNNLHNSIRNNLDAGFFDELKTSIKEEIQKKQINSLDAIHDNYFEAIKRLKGETSALSRRANLNLAIGSTVSCAALILLGFFVLKEQFNSPEMMNVLLHFLPRLSLVLFIELFAFFFLNLYKSSLAEIKYYQNEITNLELRQLALSTALTRGGEQDLSTVIQVLVNTERNFKLVKGESTVQLEKDKIDNKYLKDLISVSFGSVKMKEKSIE